MTGCARNVLITGGSRGLGAAIARAFAANGDSVFLAARSRDALERVAEGLCPREHLFAVDLQEPDSVPRLLEAVRGRWDRLDVLVNAAAILGPVGPAWECDVLEWHRTIRVNLLAPVELCRLAVPWMARGGGGSILNISGGGAADARPRFSAYATAKAGLVRFTETLAQEAAGLGVRVNAIAPGRLGTGLTREVIEAGRERAGEAEWSAAVQQEAREDDGLAQPAGLSVFLSMPAAAGITGRLISAVWDDWRGLPSIAAELAESDVYTLRRIVPKDRGRRW